MRIKKLPAIVLKSEPIQEIDLKVELLTPAGKQWVLAKGGQKSRKRFLNLLVDLNILRVNLRRGQYTLFPILDSADLIYQVKSPWEDLRKFYLFSFLAELLRFLGSTPLGEVIFNFWIGFIKWIDEGEPTAKEWLLLNLKLLQHLGYAPQIELCVRCGKKPIRIFYFSVEEGGLLCYNCRSEKVIPLSIEEIKCLQSYLSLKRIEEITKGPEVNDKLLRLIQQFLFYYIEIEFSPWGRYIKFFL